MINTFVVLAAFATKLGKVTAASMYPSGLICIDITSEEGKNYHLTYSDSINKEDNNEDSKLL